MGKIEINSLLDPGSFVEIGAEVLPGPGSAYEQDSEKIPGDGVVTGYGTIQGRLVYVYRQRAEVMAGSVGQVHGTKILKLYDLALKGGAPVIGLLDCSGVRLKEGIFSLAAFGKILKKQAEAKGKIPQIMGILGDCGGGMAACAAMADFAYVAQEGGNLFVHSANVRGADGSEKNLAATEFADGLLSEAEVCRTLQQLAALLPANCTEPAPETEGGDLNRVCSEIQQHGGDGKGQLSAVSDNGFFLETKALGAKEITTGFLYLDGRLTGGIAAEGRLSAQGLEKAAAFIEFCSAFGIQLMTLTDAEGLAVEEQQEKRLAPAMARLIKALALADSPKINVITGRAYGSAWLLMNSCALGADYTFMWQGAAAGSMSAEAAVRLWGSGTAADYEAAYNSPQALAAAGVADKIIEPQDTRKYAIGAFETLAWGFGRRCRQREGQR